MWLGPSPLGGPPREAVVALDGPQQAVVQMHEVLGAADAVGQVQHLQKPRLSAVKAAASYAVL